MLFQSCEDELDVAPSKSSYIEITELKELDALLNKDGQDGGFNEHARSYRSTDDYGLRVDICDVQSSVYKYPVKHAVWDVQTLADEENNNWKTAWRAIFTYNLVLQTIDDVSGVESEKHKLRAEAKFLRAVKYFQLVTDYCLPYCDENKSSLGLPLKKTNSYEESVKRASLEETYVFIEEGIKGALEFDFPAKDTPSGKPQNWRANNQAVLAYYAKMLLAKHDYENALKYVDLALDINNEFFSFKGLGKMPLGMYKTFDAEGNKMIEPNFVPTDYFTWPWLRKGKVFKAQNIYFSDWVIPSEDLLSIYDKSNDLRYKFRFQENFSYRKKNFTNPAFKYPGYMTSYLGSCNGMTVAELYCMKAECQARLGNWEEGISTINILRAKRINGSASSDEINLSASNQNEAILEILKERRRELPFFSRWFDLKRYNSNNTDIDDVVITRNFYPSDYLGIRTNETPQDFRLEIKDKRYALPIPNIDIANSNGQLQQNQY